MNLSRTRFEMGTNRAADPEGEQGGNSVPHLHELTASWAFENEAVWERLQPCGFSHGDSALIHGVDVAPPVGIAFG